MYCLHTIMYRLCYSVILINRLPLLLHPLIPPNPKNQIEHSKPNHSQKHNQINPIPKNSPKQSNPITNLLNKKHSNKCRLQISRKNHY